MQRFLEGNHNVGFHVAAALRRNPTLPDPAESRSSAAATEECFEKVAEAGASKFEFDATVLAAAPLKSPAALASAPLWRRLKSSRLIPIFTELIVFPPLLRVA